MSFQLCFHYLVTQLQAFFLVADDIMDESLTRRMKPCWYRTNDLGVKAFNDSILLEACIYEVIKTYCRDQPFYADILDLFHDVSKGLTYLRLYLYKNFCVFR